MDHALKYIQKDHPTRDISYNSKVLLLKIKSMLPPTKSVWYEVQCVSLLLIDFVFHLPCRQKSLLIDNCQCSLRHILLWWVLLLRLEPSRKAVSLNMEKSGVGVIILLSVAGSAFLGNVVPNFWVPAILSTKENHPWPIFKKCFISVRWNFTWKNTVEYLNHNSYKINLNMYFWAF